MCEPQVEDGVHRPRDHGAGAGPRLVAASFWPRQLVCQTALEYCIYPHAHDSYPFFNLPLGLHLLFCPYTYPILSKSICEEDIKGHLRPSMCKTV